MSEPKPKPFAISKWVVWEAYLRVKANQGPPVSTSESIAGVRGGPAGEPLQALESAVLGELFPAAGACGGDTEGSEAKASRTLGVPTVSDRIAQTVVKLYLEPEVEPLFHPDSYGYRPGRSALDAVATCRERCWQQRLGDRS